MVYQRVDYSAIFTEIETNLQTVSLLQFVGRASQIYTFLYHVAAVSIARLRYVSYLL